MMHSLDDPAELSPDERRRAIAVILAKGVLRLRPARPVAAESAVSDHADHASERRQKDLEVSAPSRPHVTTG